ncbi:MAG: amidase [bacterium]
MNRAKARGPWAAETIEGITLKSDDLAFLTVSELASRIREGDLSPVEIAEACLTRIDTLDGKLNAFITVTAEKARRAAQKAEREIREGHDRGPFHGIPIALKDLIEVEGIRMTAASKILEENVARRTATVAARLQQAGAVLLGKTNLQEFARGPTGVDSLYGSSSNPWDLSRIPGGSSSGSGAAVAGGLVPAALGSDTGGSVRIPAALSGIVGIRPTYGRVSRYGAVPLGPSFDTVGPMTRSVEDTALMLSVIAGHDPLDPSTGTYPVPDYGASLERDRDRGLKGLRLGLPSDYFFPGYDPEVESLVRDAAGVLEGLGAEIREVDIPYAEYTTATYVSVVGPESANYHREFLITRRKDYMGPTADFFEMSLFIPGWRYQKGQQARLLFMRKMAEVFREVDAVLTPAVPVAAPPIEASEDWPPILRCTLPFSTTGVPAISVPCGFTKAGLPAGLQLVGRWWDEEMLFRIGAAYEAATDWHTRIPAFPGDRPPFDAVGLEPPQATYVGEKDESKRQVSRESVRNWAAAMGLSVSEWELDDLTSRVDRTIRSISRLDDLPLKDLEPDCYFRVPAPGEDPM